VDDGSLETPSEAIGRMWRVHLLLVVASIVYCFPLLSNRDCYGRRDWDQSMFRAETARLALLRDHQLPLWNPYANGGTVLLAHPHCPAASPWYVLVLMLGAPLGLRLQVMLFMALGSTGMAALLRNQHVPAAGSLLGGILFMMTSHFALHIAEGHLEWCVLGLMPWLMICLDSEWPAKRRIIAGALLLSSVLLFGSVYIIAVFVPFLTVWATLECLRKRLSRPLVIWSAVLVVTSLLSAVKLIPQLEFASANPRETIPEGYSPRGLPTVFLDPRQALLYEATRDVFVPEKFASLRSVPAPQSVAIHNHLQQLGFEWAWHEYGCYMTWLGLAAAACGVVLAWRKNWPLYVAGLLSLVMSLGHGSPLDLWAMMQRLPLYESLHVPSRFLAAVAFVLAVAGGHGLGRLTEMRVGTSGRWWRTVLRIAVPLVVLGELTAMGWRLFDDVFVVCTPEARATLSRDSPEQRPFAIHDPPPRYFPVMTSDVYSHLMGNVGILRGYENMAVERGSVRAVGDSGYRREVWVDGADGAVEIRDWTMSRITVDVRVASDAIVLLNQNYSPGWHVTVVGDQGRRTLSAEPSQGHLVSTRIDPDDKFIEFFYHPSSVRLGAIVSSLTLIACLLVLVAGSFRTRASRTSAIGGRTAI
jgi:hypothetical protein